MQEVRLRFHRDRLILLHRRHLNRCSNGAMTMPTPPHTKEAPEVMEVTGVVVVAAAAGDMNKVAAV
jgi:hypothetical protein